MLDQLRELNFGNHAVSLIESYLENRNQKIMLTTCKSDWIQLYQGVRQGTVLGSLLNIDVNSMSKSVSNNCQLVQYAGDTMIYSAHQDKTSNKKFRKCKKTSPLFECQTDHQRR